jgi:Flp pilus assembly protein TadD
VKTMRPQPLRLALLFGLFAVLFAGCSHLGRSGRANSLGSKQSAAGWSTASSDSSGQTDRMPADADTDAAPGPPKTSTAEGEFAMARLCERRGETEQAETVYHALLKKAPRDARIYHRLAVLAVQKGDFVNAEEHFRVALSLAPPTAELLSDAGYCYYLQQKLPQAEAILKEALKLEPTYATAANNLGLVLGAEGRYRESMELFRRSNTEAEAYANMAYVLAQRGEMARAEQTYIRALTLNSTMRAAAQAVLQINQRAKTQAKFAADNAAPASRGEPQGESDQGSEPTSVPNGVEAAVVLLPPPPASESRQASKPNTTPPDAAGQGPQIVGADATAMPVEPPTAEVVVEGAADSAKRSPSESVSGVVENRSN